MNRAEAWLLPLAHGLWAAVGTAELFYLIEQPPVHFIPCAPRHCCHLLVWEGLLLPLADPGILLHARSVAPSTHVRLAAVVGYVQADGSTAYGALHLTGVPRRIEVSDTAHCTLPDPDWARIANSAFTHQHQPVAILALDRLFATAEH